MLELTWYIGIRYIVVRYNARCYKTLPQKGVFMEDKSISKHLPLTEATYYILLALVTPKHGYAVMQKAEEISQGTLRLAPGTIYGAFTTLEENKLISMVGKVGRRKMFQISEMGIRVLLGQIQRMEIMLQSVGKNFDFWQQVSAEEEKEEYD